MRPPPAESRIATTQYCPITKTDCGRDHGIILCHLAHKANDAPVKTGATNKTNPVLTRSHPLNVASPASAARRPAATAPPPAPTSTHYSMNSPYTRPLLPPSLAEHTSTSWPTAHHQCLPPVTLRSFRGLRPKPAPPRRTENPGRPVPLPESAGPRPDMTLGDPPHPRRHARDPENSS